MQNSIHYSERRKQEINRLEDRIALGEKSIQEFRAHLTSEKFFKDTTIQIKDVESRLLSILSDLRGY